MPRLILTSSFHTVAQPLLQKGLLSSKTVSVAFIPTAGDPYGERPWIDADRRALEDLGYKVFIVDLKDKTSEQLKASLDPAQMIFVAGGNTTYLFEMVHQSGFSSVIHALLAEGRVYVGSSAGSLLAGPSVEPFIEEDRAELPKAFSLHDPTGLQLVDYIILPHYPQYARENDYIATRFDGRWPFVKLTDDEYRIVS